MHDEHEGLKEVQARPSPGSTGKPFVPSAPKPQFRLPTSPRAIATIALAGIAAAAVIGIGAGVYEGSQESINEFPGASFATANPDETPYGTFPTEESIRPLSGSAGDVGQQFIAHVDTFRISPWLRDGIESVTTDQAFREVNAARASVEFDMRSRAARFEGVLGWFSDVDTRPDGDVDVIGASGPDGSNAPFGQATKATLEVHVQVLLASELNGGGEVLYVAAAAGAYTQDWLLNMERDDQASPWIISDVRMLESDFEPCDNPTPGQCGNGIPLGE